MRSLISPTAAGDWFSAAIPSDGNPYGVADGLIFSFPLRADGEGGIQIVEGLELSDYARQKIQESEAELISEREAISDLL